MKILLYTPFCAWTHHFGTDLEIITKHFIQGDEVHVIQCSGDLFSCEPNPNHYNSKCNGCMKTRDLGFLIINKKFNEFDKNLIIHELRNNNTGSYYLPKFANIKELKEYTFNGIDVGMAVASTLISSTRNSEPNLDEHRYFIEQNIYMAISIYEQVYDFLKEIEPDVFYLFNGRFAALRPALRAAQELGIKTFVHERSSVLNRYTLTEDTYPHDLTYQKNEIEKHWDEKGGIHKEARIELAQRWFKNRREGKDISWYHFTGKQKKGKLPKNFDETNINVGIFISSEDEYESIAGWKNPIYENQNDAINKIVSEIPERECHFYVSVHPNLKGLDNAQMKGINALNYPNLTVIPATSKVDSYELLEKCDKIISFGSEMGIENAYWFGNRLILIGRTFYEDLIGYKPKTHKEVIHMICKLNNKPISYNKKLLLGAYKYGYWQASVGIPFNYYVPHTVRGGKFAGVALSNLRMDKLKDIILKMDIISLYTIRLVRYIRKNIWRFKRD